MRSEEEIRKRLKEVDKGIDKNGSTSPEGIILAIAKDTLEWVLQDCDNQGCVGYRNGHCTKGKICKKK